MLDKKIQEHGENLDTYVPCVFACTWYVANIGSNIDTAGSDQTNGVVVSTVGKRTHPSVNGNASAIDPPVTIRQEPLSPAKVVIHQVCTVLPCYFCAFRRNVK